MNYLIWLDDFATRRVLVHDPSKLTEPVYGTRQPSQACFKSAAFRLGFLQIHGLVPKDSSQ